MTVTINIINYCVQISNGLPCTMKIEICATATSYIDRSIQSNWDVCYTYSRIVGIGWDTSWAGRRENILSLGTDRVGGYMGITSLCSSVALFVLSGRTADEPSDSSRLFVGPLPSFDFNTCIVRPFNTYLELVSLPCFEINFSAHKMNLYCAHHVCLARNIISASPILRIVVTNLQPSVRPTQTYLG